MKKICMGMILLLLSACGMGGSGGGGGEASVVAGTDSAAGAVAKVEVKIDDSTAKTVAAAPAASHLRLVITNPGLRINGTSFKMIVDGAIPAGNSITNLTFPVANGYVFEMVTYVPDTVKPDGTETVKRMLKYARTANVSITVEGATVSLALQPIAATFTLSTSDFVYSGAPLGITAGFASQPTPLRSAWNLFLRTDPGLMAHALHSTATPSISHLNDRAPYVLSTGTLYGQGEFYINGGLLDATGTATIIDPSTKEVVSHAAENYSAWTFNYPNPDFGDSSALVQTRLDPRGITITIPGS